MTACAPLPITYYMPSADDAKIEWHRCDQAPPYEAVMASDHLTVSAFFDGTEIDIGIFLAPFGRLEFDGKKFEFTIDGQTYPAPNLKFRDRYWKDVDIMRPDGTINVIAETFYITAASPVHDPTDLVLVVPAMTIDGVVIPARTIKFHREQKVRIRFLIINC